LISNKKKKKKRIAFDNCQANPILASPFQAKKDVHTVKKIALRKNLQRTVAISYAPESNSLLKECRLALRVNATKTLLLRTLTCDPVRKSQRNAPSLLHEREKALDCIMKSQVREILIQENQVKHYLNKVSRDSAATNKEPQTTMQRFLSLSLTVLRGHEFTSSLVYVRIMSAEV
jgi:hypothetical protein